MRVILTCGGTGGHITPALAIADVIKENSPRAEILFVGAVGGMEKELVERAGYAIRLLCVRGISRKITLQNVKALWQAHKAVREAEQLLEEFRPDIVVGTGGYASYPALRAAIRRGIPSAVHESNSVPGLTVRRLASGLDRVWLNFSEAAEVLPKSASVLYVGNPLPRGYVTPVPIKPPQGTRRMLLSFGGSLGAKAINDSVLEMMEREKQLPSLFHVHVSGKREYERVRGDFKARGLEGYSNLVLLPFLTDMPRYMAAADLVICRAGAMSISELAALGRPGILIPSPNVTGDHQYKNAMAFAARGAAICIKESELSAERLASEVTHLLADERLREEMSRAAYSFHKSDVNAVIYADICRLCRKS